ncbi:MAG TPA: endonuclease domain-containing protein [bacterium]|nr:endonuclease domain-containing protein [bacterium]
MRETVIDTREVKSDIEQTSECEELLWGQLQSERFSGLVFTRREPVGEYTVDFFCAAKRVIIECDENQDLFSRKDKKRDAWLKQQGYTVLRFWDSEMFIDMQGVLENIVDACSAASVAEING